MSFHGINKKRFQNAPGIPVPIWGWAVGCIGYNLLGPRKDYMKEKYGKQIERFVCRMWGIGMLIGDRDYLAQK